MVVVDSAVGSVARHEPLEEAEFNKDEEIPAEDKLERCRLEVSTLNHN